jgi:hypothetical protein
VAGRAGRRTIWRVLCVGGLARARRVELLHCDRRPCCVVDGRLASGGFALSALDRALVCRQPGELLALNRALCHTAGYNSGQVCCCCCRRCGCRNRLVVVVAVVVVLGSSLRARLRAGRARARCGWMRARLSVDACAPPDNAAALVRADRNGAWRPAAECRRRSPVGRPGDGQSNCGQNVISEPHKTRRSLAGSRQARRRPARSSGRRRPLIDSRAV